MNENSVMLFIMSEEKMLSLCEVKSASCFGFNLRKGVSLTCIVFE